MIVVRDSEALNLADDPSAADDKFLFAADVVAVKFFSVLSDSTMVRLSAHGVSVICKRRPLEDVDISVQIMTRSLRGGKTPILDRKRRTDALVLLRCQSTVSYTHLTLPTIYSV